MVGYEQFVLAGIQQDSPWKHLKAQVFLGNDAFVQRAQGFLTQTNREDSQIPISQRRPPAPTLQQIERDAPDRNAAIRLAYATGAYSYQQIAQHFRLHFTTVGRIVRGLD